MNTNTFARRLGAIALSTLLLGGVVQAQSRSLKTLKSHAPWDPRQIDLDGPANGESRASHRQSVAARQSAAARRNAAALPARPLPATAESSSRAVGGPPGTKDWRVDLSAAHNLVRYFGVDSPFSVCDAALARALTDDRSLTLSGIKKALDRYDAELPDVTVLPAGPTRIGAAKLKVDGPLAVIKPGTGSIELPDSVQIVVVDLRHLPAIDDLNEILPRMVAPALATPVEQPARFVRRNDGAVDEVFSPSNVYSTSVGPDQRPPLPATGARDLPIVLIVGERIAPQAASFAATLRAARRAWIAGKSVPLAVAETEWQGIGDRGLAVRTSIFENLVERPPTILPDQVAAQDDSDLYDPSLSTYHHEFSVPEGIAEMKVSTDGHDTDDLDLFLVYDYNGDGVFDFWSEYFAASVTDGPQDEHIQLAYPPSGNYQVLVFGYSVPAGTTTFTLEIDQTEVIPLPDELRPDLPVDLKIGDDGDSDAADSDGDDDRYARLAAQVIGVTPPPVSGPAERTPPLPVDPFGFHHPESGGRGELRAALIAAHGAVRRFYRYFPDVGDTIDDRLVETLGLAGLHDGVDRLAAWRILRRFGEALHDGHQFMFNYYPFSHLGNLPVFLEHPGGRPDRPVVRRSLAAEIHPGDTIVALEGRPIAEVYAEELARTSAATPGYQLDIADRYIYRMFGPLTLTLEDTYGVQRTVTVPVPTGNEYNEAVSPGVSDRPNGSLADLGAPQLYYLNMHRFTTPTDQAMRAAIRQASRSGATGMVLDMRGFPGANHYEVALRLIREPFLTPIFKVNVFNGVDDFSVSSSQYSSPLPYGPPRFDGPIVLLTGPHAVSAAENFMQMLVGAGRPLAVVGQRSAGTNGNITGVQLPGGFGFSYTGMEVRNPNGSRFHGIGIKPDVFVPLTAEDLRDGVDRDLLTAIDLLH